MNVAMTVARNSCQNRLIGTWLGLSLLGLGFFGHLSHAASYTMEPGADAFTTAGPFGNLGDSNFGGAGALSIAPAGAQNGEFQTVMRFDSTNAKSFFDSTLGAGSWTVSGASLQLTAANPRNGIFNPSNAGQFGIDWMANSTWQEGAGRPSAPTSDGITYNSLRGVYVNPLADANLGIFSFNGATSGQATYSLALPPALVAQILDGHSFSLRLYATDAQATYLFYSRDFIQLAADHPHLTINAQVPEPGLPVATLLAGSLLALHRRRRSHRQPNPAKVSR
jgi:hypothetical protein